MGATTIVWMALWTASCCALIGCEPRHRLTSVDERLYQLLNLSQRDHYSRSTRAEIDLRENRLYYSNARLECCPTVTRTRYLKVGVNRQGLLLELLHTPNISQKFYVTLCRSYIKDKPCQFIDERYATYSRCEQQYSYETAMGRNYNDNTAQFRIVYIRVATGCKCKLQESVLEESLQWGDR